MKKQKPCVMLAASGSGGHLFAAQSLASSLSRLVDVEIVIVGATANSGMGAIDTLGFEYVECPSPRPSRKKMALFVANMLKGTFKAWRLILRKKPVLIVGFGSYHSVTPLLAACFSWTPIILFESNMLPGKVIRLFSRFSLYTATLFKEARAHLKGEVRQVAFASKHERSFLSKSEAKKRLGLYSKRFTFLVFGGSQGAAFINQIMAEIAALASDKELFQIVHITGKKGDTNQVYKRYVEQGIKAYVAEFFQDMDPVYKACDACIARSGALTVFELMDKALVSFLIPLPSASENHQYYNALFMQEKGFAQVCIQKNLTAGILLDWMITMASDKALINKKRQQMQTFYRSLDLPRFESMLVKEHVNTHYTLAGIGGIGMSSLAQILIQDGTRVAGFDATKSSLTDQLKKLGVQLHIGPSIDLVNPTTLVVSSAIKEDHVVCKEATKKEVSIWHRSKLLEHVMKGYQVIAVAGTHGKTSTSGLLAYLLESLGMSPSYAVGGEFVDGRAHGKRGSSYLFIAEADESDGSFLNYVPSGGILTNLETDHLDYWKTRDALNQGFKSFVASFSATLPLFYCIDDKGLEALKLEGISYGESEKADLRLVRLESGDRGQTFDFQYKGKVYKNCFLSLLGKHQVINALGAIGMALELGADFVELKKMLKGFSGMKKRLEFIADRKGVHFYKDYAHHPTETLATLKALRSRYQDKTITCLYQPHRFSRMPLFLKQSTSPFAEADRCVLFDVFSAGEKPESDNSQALLSKLIDWGHKKAEHYADLQSFKKSAPVFSSDEVVVLMGAGSIHNWAEDVINKV